MSLTNNIYPFILTPIFKNHLWGGDWPLDYKKESEDDSIFNSPVGECWHFSDLSENSSIIQNGEFKGFSLEALIKKEGMREKVLGDFKEIKILLKTINPFRPLSIQVHPSDDDVVNGMPCLGKEEGWIILGVKENGEEKRKLYLGFKEGTTFEDIKKSLMVAGPIPLLNEINPKKGQNFLIKPGTVHGLGAGIMVLEIQQSSNTTYRLYDYDRVDSSGKKRDLHIEECLGVLKLGEGEQSKEGIKSSYFKVEEKSLNDSFTFNQEENGYHVLHFINGKGKRVIHFLGKEMILEGVKTLMIPASIKTYDLVNSGDSEPFYLFFQK